MLSFPTSLQADSLTIANWWIDASYAVHPDFKSHSGGVFSLGHGGIYGTSTRQKINAKSSIEAEFIGVAEVLPQVLWTRYFLEAQGFTDVDTVVHQDNKSTIKSTLSSCALCVCKYWTFAEKSWFKDL